MEASVMSMNEKELIEFNKKINAHHSMRILEENRNPLIRYIIHRRNQIISDSCRWENQVVADIGCQEGNLSRIVFGRVKELYCVDIDDEMIRNLSDDLAKLQLDRTRKTKIHFLTMNAENMRQIKDDSVDVVSIGCLLAHVPSPQKVLLECIRILKSDGRLLICSSNDTFNLRIKKWIQRLGLSKFFPKIEMQSTPGHLHESNDDFHQSLIHSINEIEVLQWRRICWRTFIYICCKIKK